MFLKIFKNNFINKGKIWWSFNNLKKVHTSTLNNLLNVGEISDITYNIGGVVKKGLTLKELKALMDDDKNLVLDYHNKNVSIFKGDISSIEFEEIISNNINGRFDSIFKKNPEEVALKFKNYIDSGDISGLSTKVFALDIFSADSSNKIIEADNTSKLICSEVVKSLQFPPRLELFKTMLENISDSKIQESLALFSEFYAQSSDSIKLGYRHILYEFLENPQVSSDTKTFVSVLLSCESADSIIRKNVESGLMGYFPNSTQSFLFLKLFAGRSLFLGSSIWGLKYGFSSDIFNSLGPLVCGFPPYFGSTLVSLQQFSQFFKNLEAIESNPSDHQIKYADLITISENGENTEIVETPITPRISRTFIWDKMMPYKKLLYGIGGVGAVGAVYLITSLFRNTSSKTTVEVYTVLSGLDQKINDK